MVTWSPSLQAKPIEQQRVGDDAEAAVALGWRARSGSGGVGPSTVDRADQRIVGVDGADGEEGCSRSPTPARPMTSMTSLTVPSCSNSAPLLRVGGAIGELGFEVAAEQGAGIARQRRLQRRADRADDGDGADAERQAGEEDGEAAEVAAQVASARRAASRAASDGSLRPAPAR